MKGFRLETVRGEYRDQEAGVGGRGSGIRSQEPRVDEFIHLGGNGVE